MTGYIAGRSLGSMGYFSIASGILRILSSLSSYSYEEEGETR